MAQFLNCHRCCLHRPERKTWSVDGDDASIMHMGSIVVIAHMNSTNLIHIVFNNSLHASVGGQPTVMGNVNIATVSKDCGYPDIVTVDNFDKLDKGLQRPRNGMNLV